MEKGILEIKEHTHKKYRILGKYLGACKTFNKKYRNFAYVDTHAGSGKVLFEGDFEDGSPLIARAINPSFPCYVIEINEDRYKILNDSVTDLPNITAIHGDCNEKIPEVLRKIPGWKFTLCFVDPDSLIDEYTGCHELSWKTIEQISQGPKTEILLNFPLMPIVRNIGYVLSGQKSSKTQKFKDNLVEFFGTDKWIEIGTNRKKLLDFYLSERLRGYEFKGAILIRTGNAPLYYLVFGSHHKVGAKIMRDVMRKEWRGGQQFLANFNDVYPLTYFVFD